MCRKILLLCVMMVVLCGLVNAAIDVSDNDIDLHVFYGEGCPHCEKLKLFLDEVIVDNPMVVVHFYEVYNNDTARDLFVDMSREYGAEVKYVPVVFVNDERIEGFGAAQEEMLMGEIEYCSNNVCSDPMREYEYSVLSEFEKNESVLVYDDSKKESMFLEFSVFLALCLMFLLLIFYYYKKKK